MNTLIAYDSHFGNTEQVVLKMEEALRASGQVQTVRVEHTHPLYVQAVDLLILGCPTQKWGTTPANERSAGIYSGRGTQAPGGGLL